MGQEEAMLLVALAGVVGGAVGARQAGGIAWQGAVAAALGTMVPVALLAAFAMESIAVAIASALIAVCVTAAAFGFSGKQMVAVVAGMVLAGGVATAVMESVATL